MATGLVESEHIMSTLDDSQFSRLVIERKFCTLNEVELVRAEQQELRSKGKKTPLSELMTQHGFITHTQISRLQMAMDEDSMYRPAQQIPGFQILGKLGQGAMAVVFKAKQLSLVLHVGKAIDKSQAQSEHHRT